MARSFLTQRIAWLTTAILFVACASAPEPTTTKRKKKRKSDRTALKKKKKKSSQAEREAKEEQPDKPFKSQSVVITDADDDEDEDTSSAKKRKKDEEAEEAAAEKKRKKDEEAEEAAAEKKRKKDEEAEEAAAEKKRKKDEEAEAVAEKKRKKEEEAEEAKRKKEEEAEEAAAEKKRKKDEEAEKTAAAKKRKKEVEAEEAAFEAPEEVDADDEKPAKKKKVAKSEPAEVDMSGTGDADVIEMEGEEEPPAGERRVAAIAVPGVDSEEEQEEIAASEPLTPGATPLSINNRSLTLGKGKLSVHGGLRVTTVTLPNLAGMAVSTTTQSFALGGTYGVSDKLEVGADYTLGLSPGNVKGPLTLHGAYKVSAGAKLDVAVGAALSVDYYTTTDPATMQSTTRTLASFGLGAWARYRLNRKLSLFTGLPALPDSTVALSKTTIPLPPLPYHLAIGLNGGGAIAFDAPIGLGYQASPKLYAFVDVDFAHFRIKNTANRFLFKDFIPIQLGAFYALSKLDIGAQFSDDLKQGFDFLRFDIVARYSIK